MTFKVNREATTMNLAVRSLHLISNLVELSEGEAQARTQAIVTHDGLCPAAGAVNSLDHHHRECRLELIVHFADKWTAAVDEEGRRQPPTRAAPAFTSASSSARHRNLPLGEALRLGRVASGGLAPQT